MFRSAVWIITFLGGLFFVLEFVLPDYPPEAAPTAPATKPATGPASSQASTSQAATGLSTPGLVRPPTRPPAAAQPSSGPATTSAPAPSPNPGGFRNPLTPYLGDATAFITIVMTMAFLVGPINLVRSHAVNIARRQRGWVESGMFIVALVVGFVIQSVVAPDDISNIYYNAMFNGLILGFGGASMAILSCYLVSAAYRSFRMNSPEAGLMMVSAVIVLLGLVPVGNWITGWLPEGWRLSDMADWILTFPNNAVQRAIGIGAAGGAFAMGLRQWLSLGKSKE